MPLNLKLFYIPKLIQMKAINRSIKAHLSLL